MHGDQTYAGQSRLLWLPLTLVALTLASPVSGEVTLPEGAGKSLVQSACTRCHGLDKLDGVRLSPADWRSVIDLMMTYGTPLTKEDASVVSAYLSRSFPGAPKPAGRTVPGPIEATIREWTLPTPGSRPHDPLVAPDGSVWYTGQARSMLGRLDPATGEFKEYPLEAPKAAGRWLPYGVGPHGLIADKQGDIWFTGQLAEYIGRLNPRTGAVIEYRMPDAQARDPHTPIFDQTGTLWFTLQNSNMVGKIDPDTGKVQTVPVPTPGSQPYGIVVNSKGVPFFAQLTGARLGSINPATLEVREYPLPHAGSAPRRIAVTADDVLWYTDYARGYLGRLDPDTGRVSEWPSPSGAGPATQPYAITAVGHIVWYVEGGTNPNMVVRFDPATEQFQSWPIPSGGGVVRHMVASPDGSLWLACSAVDRLAKVEVKGSTVSAPRGGDAPRLAGAPPDLSGIWQVLSAAAWDLEGHAARAGTPAGLSVVEGGDIPYQPWAAKKKQENFARRDSADPENRCYLPGVPRITYMPYPFQILQTPSSVMLIYEYVHAQRTVYTDGTDHPPGHIDWWMGDSRGRWEGDTLVVDVVDFNDQTWLDRAGNFHSDELHVVERYRRRDADHIDYEATIEDPKVFTRPWKMSLVLYRRLEPMAQILEYECYAFDHPFRALE